MPPIAFTANYTDHSNSTGFQFEFHCDKCGNGHMSSCQVSKVSVAGGLLRAAASLFGTGWGAAHAAHHLKDALRGKAWDEAFKTAVAECKGWFKQCTRCGKWVCPETCWNEARTLCESCAPDLAKEAAAAQAQAAAEQGHEKARKTDQVAHVDVSAKAQKVAACPHCGARVTGGKFCASCGQALVQKKHCPACGAEIGTGAKFCPECGQRESESREEPSPAPERAIGSSARISRIRLRPAPPRGARPPARRARA